jgi:hypothetical protein
MSLLLNAETEESFPRPDSLATHDLERALVEMVEEIEIDWPESVPVERIKALRNSITFFAQWLYVVASRSDRSNTGMPTNWKRRLAKCFSEESRRLSRWSQ